MQQPEQSVASTVGGSRIPLRWVASLLYAGVLCMGSYAHTAGLCVPAPSIGSHALFSIVLGVLLVLEHVAHAHSLRSGTIALTLLAVRMGLFEVVALTDCSGLSHTLTLLIPFIAYLCLGPRASYALAMLYLALFVGRLWWADPAWYFDQAKLADLLMYFVGLVFAVSMAGVASIAERHRTHAAQLLTDLEHSHQQLKASSKRTAELAATEERNRLARDIHDSLGHYLTTIHLLLDKAIAYRPRNPNEADQAVWDAKRSARQALQDVRDSVGALRTTEETFSLSVALTELVRTMATRRLDIDYRLTGEEAGVPKLVLLTLYRAAQEGFTNIQKHARASHITLLVTLDANQARLVLSDNGCGFDPTLVDALPTYRTEHFGLQGLRERVELVGGAVEIQSSATHGTQLTVTVAQQPHRATQATRPFWCTYDR